MPSGEWTIVYPVIHPSNTINLIKEVSEAIFKDYDFELAAHSAHEKSGMEQLNILSDLMNKIHETSPDNLGTILQTSLQTLCNVVSANNYGCSPC